MGKLKFARKILFLLLGVPLLTGCDVSEAIPDIQSKLIPSWLSFVVQILALIVLLLIVIFIAYKPMKKMLKKRADYIENNIKESEKNRAISEQNAIQSNENLIASKAKANEIIEQAKQQADKEKLEILENANKEVIKMKEKASLDIENSKKEALDSIHDEMVDVALYASSEILKREVNKEDNERLTKEFIDKL